MKKLVVFIMIIAFLLIIPVGLWLLKNNQPIKVTIIDKSAVEDSHREHLGINWVLNYSKVRADHNKPYDPALDYYGGFTSIDGKGVSEIYPLPQDYSGTDIIYLANTSTSDEISQELKDPLLAAYEKTHGGLAEVEWERILKRLNTKEPSMFIAEFNSFSEPTTEKIRGRVAERLGVKFSGWKGLYVAELNPKKNEELKKDFSKSQTDWDYSGPGFILVNDSTRETIALQQDQEFTGEGIKLTFTDKGQQRFDMSGTHKFHSWFDIVTVDQGDSLAKYDWNLTTKGKDLLKEKGIPSQFDAVIRNKAGVSESLYFAGNFNSVPNIPIIYQVKGIAVVYKTLQRSTEKSFFWSTYVPMMQETLEQFGQVEEKDYYLQNAFKTD